MVVHHVFSIKSHKNIVTPLAFISRFTFVVGGCGRSCPPFGCRVFTCQWDEAVSLTARRKTLNVFSSVSQHSPVLMIELRVKWCLSISCVLKPTSKLSRLKPTVQLISMNLQACFLAKTRPSSWKKASEVSTCCWRGSSAATIESQTHLRS